MDVTKLPIAKTIDKALEKPATTGGKVINALLLAIFTPLLKYEVKKETELEAYKQKILDEISKIPEEKQVEPPLNIVGPAIEASKFYIEANELKTMFAKLIASSMNKDNKDNTHPSFVEIIKQLSPLDAQNLSVFANNNKLPIVKFRFEDTTGRGVDFKTNIFLSNSNFMDINLIAASLSNINRLGLIDIDYSTHFIDESLYEDFKNHPEYLEYKDFLDSTDFAQLMYFTPHMDISVDFSKYNNIVINKGVASLTPLGKSFVKSCI